MFSKRRYDDVKKLTHHLKFMFWPASGIVDHFYTMNRETGGSRVGQWDKRAPLGMLLLLNKSENGLF